MKPLGLLEKCKTRMDSLFKRSNGYILIELTRAKIKVIDHNTVLGFLWSLIAPISMLVVMWFIFKTHFGKEIHAYPLYLLIGISCVGHFVTATTYIFKVFALDRELVLNSMVPREIVILSHLFIHAYKFFIEIALCVVFSIFYGLISWKLILLVPLLLSYFAFVLGIGFIVSLVYCFARDAEHIWMIASRLLFFATPIFYAIDRISSLARKVIYWGNPLTPFLISFREIILGKNGFDIFTYIYSLLLGAVIFIFGYYIFIRYEDEAIERA